MAGTWISSALGVGLKVIERPLSAVAGRARRKAPLTAQQQLSNYGVLADQMKRLLAFRKDSLIPLMQDAMGGSQAPSVAEGRARIFAQKAADLRLTCTHPALDEIAGQMQSLEDRDFRLEDTYQRLIHLKLSIEEADRALSAKKRELDKR